MITSKSFLYQITALCAESFLTVSVVYGTGNHQDLFTPDDLVRCNLWSWIGQITAIVGLVWGRFAVIAFLFALQGSTHPRWQISLFIVGAAQAIVNFIEIGLILNQCTPTRKLWDLGVQGTCDNIDVCSKVGFLQGSTSIRINEKIVKTDVPGIGAFSDAFLALYPIVLIGRLQQMKLSMKVGLCIVMGGGLIAFAAGIVKTYQISTITHTQDISYATLDLLIFVSTEMWFIIIFGSFPAVHGAFVAAGKNIKARATGQSDISELSSARRTAHQVKEDSWIELSSGEQQYGSRVTASAEGRLALNKTESEEEILSPRVMDGDIRIVRETTIGSEQRTESKGS
ncbi:hypothetical protein LTR62_001962 [Meristemomyces frigidus]|uniref:Rhodopsin domain-containing protein n=1 Tax=Meristemomyces frigidus TaxID=1508187 RepID=A0AAN7YFY8_9PEZI|nr:hypothetical protein LTR62_001962 [Meristemomyces frigidus]